MVSQVSHRFEGSIFRNIYRRLGQDTSRDTSKTPETPQTRPQANNRLVARLRHVSSGQLLASAKRERPVSGRATRGRSF